MVYREYLLFRGDKPKSVYWFGFNQKTLKNDFPLLSKECQSDEVEPQPLPGGDSVGNKDWH